MTQPRNTTAAAVEIQSKYIGAKVDRARIGRLIGKLVVPDGFIQTIVDDDWLKALVLTWATPDNSIEIKACFYTRDSWYWKQPKDKRCKEVRVNEHLIDVGGHTEFNTKDGRLSFDHYGVSDSFNWDSSMRYNKSTLQECMTEQIEKARATQARHASTEYKTCPRVNTLLTLDQVAKYAQQLKANKTIRLTPGGMGIGWQVTKDAPRGGWQRGWSRADDLSAFFDVYPLYAQAFDHD